MEISITLKITFNKTSKKIWCNFHIDKTKESLVKHQLKMLGMVREKLYETTSKQARAAIQLHILEHGEGRTEVTS